MFPGVLLITFIQAILVYDGVIVMLFVVNKNEFPAVLRTLPRAFVLIIVGLVGDAEIAAPYVSVVGSAPVPNGR
jgi:hypothetical protein